MQRNLYRVVVTLRPAADGPALDVASTRFGVRTITTDGWAPLSAALLIHSTPRLIKLLTPKSTRSELVLCMPVSNKRVRFAQVQVPAERPARLPRGLRRCAFAAAESIVYCTRRSSRTHHFATTFASFPSQHVPAAALCLLFVPALGCGTALQILCIAVRSEKRRVLRLQDAIYPLTVAAPRTNEPYDEKLKLAHGLGFNFVRHHSNVRNMTRGRCAHATRFHA